MLVKNIIDDDYYVKLVKILFTRSGTDLSRAGCAIATPAHTHLIKKNY